MPIPCPPTVRLLPSHGLFSLVAFVRSTPTAPETRVRIRSQPDTWWCCDHCRIRGYNPTRCPHVTAVLAAMKRKEHP